MKRFVLLLGVLFLVLTSGCGYRIGSLMHPQIKTVAVAPVGNDTLMYNLSPQLRNMLIESFQSDGSLKVVQESQADCIVYAKVTSVSFNEIAWSESDKKNDTFLPNEWGVRLSASVAVMIPGRAAPLLAERTITGSATFTSGPDLEASRTYAVRQACYDAAKKMVIQLTEAW